MAQNQQDDTPTGLDLSRLLQEHEVQVLQSVGLDPQKYTVLPLKGTVMRSDALDSGRVVTVAVQVPDGVFMDAGTRLAVVGRKQEWLAGRAPLIPELRLVITKDAITPEISANLRSQLAALDAEQDKP
jgi:hypothetical protein